MDMQLWNRFHEFENMLERFTHASDKELTKATSSDLGLAEWAPTVDIEEEENKYLIKADLPGVDKKDIEVKLEDGVLSIRGEKNVERETGKGTKRHRSERFHGVFARSFTMPATVEPDKVDASYKDGVLSLVIPKSHESRPRAIDIKVH